MAERSQKFGGPWSVVKLNDVENYLRAFSNVLKNQPYKRIYIDAFAGSGEMTYKSGEALPLFDEGEQHTKVQGSAKRALAVAPPFDQLTFIDNKKKNIEALEKLTATQPSGRCSIIRNDANAAVRSLCQTTDWATTRGVIFLDPFGNAVEWPTLSALAKTKLDVWYLFPLCGMYRNAPIDMDQLTADKKASITRTVGTAVWEERFYVPPPGTHATLFDLPTTKSKRSINVDGIEAFVKERLLTEFPVVLNPKRILGHGKKPMFSLFFAMSNASDKARARATTIANYILKGT